MLGQFYKIAAIVCAILAVVAGIGCYLLSGSADRAGLRADAAEDRARALEQQILNADRIIKFERQQSDKYKAIGDEYEKQRDAAGLAADAAIAGLRAGTKRLQKQWGGCETDRLAASTASAIAADEATRDREEAIRRILRIGAEADAQIRGLQAVIKVDRGIDP